MPTRTSAFRHDNVAFRFLGNREDCVLTGTVLVRDREMVLEILAGGDGPYLIVGKSRKHFFEGTNSASGMHNPVNAKWAAVGESYVGIWTETGYDYLFSFDLG